MSRIITLMLLSLLSISAFAKTYPIDSGLRTVVDVSYVDSIKKLGLIADTYDLKLVSYSVPGYNWKKIKIVALAGEIDEKIWEIPLAFTYVKSVTIKGTKLSLIGQVIDEASFKVVDVKFEVNFNIKKKISGQPSLLEDRIHLKKIM